MDAPRVTRMWAAALLVAAGSLGVAALGWRTPGAARGWSLGAEGVLWLVVALAAVATRPRPFRTRRPSGIRDTTFPDAVRRVGRGGTVDPPEVHDAAVDTVRRSMWTASTGMPCQTLVAANLVLLEDGTPSRSALAGFGVVLYVAAVGMLAYVAVVRRRLAGAEEPGAPATAASTPG